MEYLKKSEPISPISLRGFTTTSTRGCSWSITRPKWSILWSVREWLYKLEKRIA
jgi:hypothetical protein